MKYKLMHKNDICAIMSLTDNTKDFESIKISNPELMPFLGNANNEKMRIWWKMRAVPSSRKIMMDVIRRAGCLTSEEYLAKNLALSMIDCYWICPIDMEIRWEDVSLWNFSQSGSFKIPYHNATSYDPNATLGGQMEKYWDLSGDVPVLVKHCDSYHGQQAVNEVIASLINKVQDNNIPFVSYKAERDEVGTLVKCNAFTSQNIELISAYEVVNSTKKRNDKSNYEMYIDICTGLGISGEFIQEFMDYQTLADFIISNTDRHLMNFGILRDADTLQIIQPAPIFDNGNSMFLREAQTYNRATILQREITAFFDKEEKLLKHVRNKNAIDLSKLPSPKEIGDFYNQLGIPQLKSKLVAHNYSIKLELARDFQHGKTISYYFESQDLKRLDKQNESSPEHFILLSGLPGANKTLHAIKEGQALFNKGFVECSAQDIFTPEQNSQDDFYIDKEKLKYDALEKNKHINREKSFVLISANDTRAEFPLKDDDYVFAIMDVRIDSALQSKCSVILDAANLDSDTREKFFALADNYNTKEKVLILCNTSIEHAQKIHPEILREKLEQMYNRFISANKHLPTQCKIKTFTHNINLAIDDDIER